MLRQELRRPALVHMIEGHTQNPSFSQRHLAAHCPEDLGCHRLLSRSFDSSAEAPLLAFTAHENEAPKSETAEIEQLTGSDRAAFENHISNARETSTERHQLGASPARQTDAGEVDDTDAHRPLSKGITQPPPAYSAARLPLLALPSP